MGWSLFLVLVWTVFSVVGAFGAWQNHLVPITNIDFVSAAWSSATTVVMVGYNDDNGGIIRSTNTGLNWFTISSSVSKVSDIASVSITANSGTTTYFVTVATDGTIYVSSNDGQTFTSTTTLSALLYGVDIGNNGNAYAVGVSTSPAAGIVYLSTYSATNSYTVWNERTPNPGASVLFTAVASFNGTNAIVVGYKGYIFYTSNSGTSWAQGTSTTQNDLQCVSSASAMVAFAGGNSATVVKTINGGAIWTSVAGGLPYLGGSSAAFSFHAVSALSGTAVYMSTSTGYIIYSYDSGNTWALDTPATGKTLVSIAMHSRLVGVAGVSRGGQVYTKNSNPTAMPTPPPTATPSFLPTPIPTSMPTFATAQPSSYPTGYPTGYTSSTPAAWTTSFTGSVQNIMRSAVWSNSTNIVAVGTQRSLTGLVLHSNNGGFKWTATTTSANTPLKFNDVATYTAVNVVTGNTVYFVAVANTGLIYRSFNGGNSWTTGASVNATLNGVAIDANGFAYAVATGNGGTTAMTIFRSSVASQFGTWVNISPSGSTQSTLQAVTATATVAGHVIAVGSSGVIWVSFNSKAASPTWTLAPSGVPSTVNLYCIATGGSDSNHSVAAGTFETMLKTMDGGLTWTSLASALKQLTAIGSSNNFQYHAIAMLSEATIYASASNGVIIRSVNGGLSFTVEVSLTNDGNAAPLRCLAMQSSLIGMAGDNVGESYIKVYAPTSAPSSVPTYAPSFVGQTLQPSSSPSTLTPTTSTPTIFGYTYSPSTATPSAKPSTATPTARPTYRPTMTPTTPTYAPTASPTFVPTPVPSSNPSYLPTPAPSTVTPSTATPTRAPVFNPTGQPSGQPTTQPSGQPTSQPVSRPTGQPTRQPTGQPSAQPTRRPTSPTGQPSGQPSGKPSGHPTSHPALLPTGRPTDQPTGQPTSAPSLLYQLTINIGIFQRVTGISYYNFVSNPAISRLFRTAVQSAVSNSKLPLTDIQIVYFYGQAVLPSSQPTSHPSGQPTGQPTQRPTSPTGQPTGQPTRQPTGQPTRRPSGQPTGQPTRQPTGQPTGRPTSPSSRPTGQPSGQPSGQPTSTPTHPTHAPTVTPTFAPSPPPTTAPTPPPSATSTFTPSFAPSRIPTLAPTPPPSLTPTVPPTAIPTTAGSRRRLLSEDDGEEYKSESRDSEESAGGSRHLRAPFRSNHLQGLTDRRETEEWDEGDAPQRSLTERQPKRERKDRREGRERREVTSNIPYGLHMVPFAIELESTGTNFASVGINYTVTFQIEKYGFVNLTHARNTIISQINASVAFGHFDAIMRGKAPPTNQSITLLASSRTGRPFEFRPYLLTVQHTSLKPTPKPTSSPTLAPTQSYLEAASKLSGLSQTNIEIVSSVVSIAGIIIIALILYFCCRRRLAACYERCTTIGSRKSQKNDDEPGFCARLCGCCAGGDDDDDQEEEEEDDEDNKKSKKGAKSARSWGKKGADDDEEEEEKPKGRLSIFRGRGRAMSEQGTPPKKKGSMFWSKHTEDDDDDEEDKDGEEDDRKKKEKKVKNSKWDQKGSMWERKKAKDGSEDGSVMASPNTLERGGDFKKGKTKQSWGGKTKAKKGSDEDEMAYDKTYKDDPIVQGKRSDVKKLMKSKSKTDNDDSDDNPAPKSKDKDKDKEKDKDKSKTPAKPNWRDKFNIDDGDEESEPEDKKKKKVIEKKIEKIAVEEDKDKSKKKALFGSASKGKKGDEGEDYSEPTFGIQGKTSPVKAKASKAKKTEEEEDDSINDVLSRLKNKKEAKASADAPKVQEDEDVNKKKEKASATKKKEAPAKYSDDDDDGMDNLLNKYKKKQQK